MTIQDLDKIIADEFKTNDFTSIDTINGIQVSRSDADIKKIAYAVDSSLDVIETAALQKVDVLFVHHGFFWGAHQPIKETLYKKIKRLIESDIALYALHLPLDAHMELGNNAQIARHLGLSSLEGFCNIGKGKHQYIGVQGIFEAPQHIDALYEKFFQHNNYHTNMPIIHTPSRRSQSPPSYNAIGMHRGSKTDISKVAIISGGGTKEIEKAYHSHVDLYITGDASHIALLQAKELDLNVWFAGHYFTEVWGVIALGLYLEHRYKIQPVFIDSPTDL